MPFTVCNKVCSVCYLVCIRKSAPVLTLKILVGKHEMPVTALSFLKLSIHNLINRR